MILAKADLVYSQPDSKPLLPKDALGKAHVRLAIDLISKSIIPAFFKLMQAQEKEKQDEGREGLS